MESVQLLRDLQEELLQLLLAQGAPSGMGGSQGQCVVALPPSSTRW